MSDCPCGSGLSLSECCQPIISADKRAETAEALIRARYTAHTLGDMDYILATHHPSTRADIDEAATRHTHHERGVFEKYHGQWYFRDAEVPDVDQFRRDRPKQGRNEPCGCGSGKKYKKCCAA